MRRRSEKYAIEGSKYTHWIGLCLSFHLNWVLGPFVHGGFRIYKEVKSLLPMSYITPLIESMSFMLFDIRTWLPYSMYFPSLRLVEAVEASIIVRELILTMVTLRLQARRSSTGYIPVLKWDALRSEK